MLEISVLAVVGVLANNNSLRIFAPSANFPLTYTPSVSALHPGAEPKMENLPKAP
jgi:hypothetical protein